MANVIYMSATPQHQEEMAALMLAHLEAEMPNMSEQAREFALRAISAKIQGQDLDSIQPETGGDSIDEGVTLGGAGTELLERFEHTGDMETLVESISLLQTALEHFPPGHKHRDTTLNNLANAFLNYARETGDREMLTQSIELHRESLLSRPEGHPLRHTSLNNLANSLKTHFEEVGDMTILIESIELRRESLRLTPNGHSSRHTGLNNLANSLKMLYEQVGDTTVLTESIELHREAVLLTQPGHPLRHTSLNNLSSSLLTRFEEVGDMETLAESIEHFRESLSLRPRGHPDRYTSLNNLAGSLLRCFEQVGDMEALSESIELYRESLLLMPHGHLHRQTTLNNLANSLLTRYEQLRDMAALEESITLFQEALDLRPMGHPGRGNSLHNLANSHLRHFEHDGDEESLFTALHLRKQCLDAWPIGHLSRHDAHFAVANTLLRDSPHFNWREAFENISAAIEDKVAPARSRLRQAIQSLRIVEVATIRNREELTRSPEALAIYVAVIRLLPRVAHLGLDAVTRLRELSGSEQLCRIGAARAILLSQFVTAVELLEEGGNVFWQQALQLRSSALDDLPLNDRSRLLYLFNTLDSPSHESTGKDRAETERNINDRRRLSEEAERLIEEIRSRPGFDRFLSPPDFAQLSRAAVNGPVVILNEHMVLSVAIIINMNWSDKMRLVPLPRVALNKLHKLTQKVAWYNLRGGTASDLDLETSDADTADTDTVRGAAFSRPQTRTPLEELWITVVEPVVRELGIQVSYI